MKLVPVEQTDPSPPFSRLLIDGREYWPVVDFAAVEQFASRRRPPDTSPDTLRLRYLVALVTEGEGEIAHDGTLYPVVPGSIVLSSPGFRRSLIARSRNGITFYTLLFSYVDADRDRLQRPIGDLLELVAGEPLRPSGVVEQAGIFAAGRLMNAFNALQRPWRQHPMPWFLLHRRFQDYLLALIELVLLPEAYGPGVPPGLLAAKAEIDRRFREPISLIELARLADLTPNYLCRRFKENFGQPPRDYQMALQMRFAQAQLAHTGYRVKEIADQAGFCSQQHFARLFKERTGLSPSEYRAHAATGAVSPSAAR